MLCYFYFEIGRSFCGYKPISILLHLAKILKLIIYNCIKRNLSHILISQKYGFRLSKSTITSNMTYTSFVSDCFHSNLQVDVITTNFPKSFDTIHYHLPTTEIETLDIGESLQSWFKSYILIKTNLHKSMGLFLI